MQCDRIISGYVDRRTGGLEISTIHPLSYTKVDRRTGGLENADHAGIE